MNITPTSAATGICSINPDAHKIKHNKNSAAETPDKRVRPPDLTLIML